MPMEMKKRLAKLSRKGRISDRIWWANSDSESASPARKAPRASDNPSCPATQAVPRLKKMVAMRKISLLRRWTMVRQSGGKK